MIKKGLLFIGFVLVFLAGILLARWYFQATEIHKEDRATVLLDRIKTVARLVTVEGYFSEIYDYKDYYTYDFSPLRKKALLRVKAKVSVGYDLTEMKVEVRPVERQLIISNLPDPEILSIDHEVDYYDIQEGAFNSFSPQDYTRLNQNAKNLIEQKALQSDLFIAAEEQGNKLLEIIDFMAEGAGYELVYAPRGGMQDFLEN